MVGLLVLLAIIPASAAGSGRATTVVSISGHGFGHGIGLSQWGAEERAAAGQAYPRILAFYYPGTKLGTGPSRNVRVLVADRAKLTIGSHSAFTVRDRHDRVVHLSPGLYPVGPGTAFARDGLAWPIVASPGSDLLQVGGVRYRGTITLRPMPDGHVMAVNTVDIESYVADVVSAECPAYWRPNALRAQAVASRSYALANLRPGAPFDLYPDDRSQNYRGAAREFPSARAAAAATKSQILLYRDQPADTMFSASNGGLTSALPSLPYLATRRDPFDARSPDADWGPVAIGVATLRRAFPTLPQVVVAVQVTRNSAERVVTVTFDGADGLKIDIPGPRFQQRLGLRSTYFSLRAGF